MYCITYFYFIFVYFEKNKIYVQVTDILFITTYFEFKHNIVLKLST